jgi:hypothetical protein
MRERAGKIAALLTAVGILALPSQALGVEVLADGGFEANGAPWGESSSYPGADIFGPGGPICPPCNSVDQQHGGVGYVQFGGAYNNANVPQPGSFGASVAQTLTIPAGVATLRFYLDTSFDSGDSVFDARLDGASVFSTTITQNTPYTEVVVELGAFPVSGAHTLVFVYSAGGEVAANSFAEAYGLDDVSLDVQPLPADGGEPPPPAEIERMLALHYARAAFRGTLGPAGPCAIEERVTLFAKKPGKNRRIGSDRTNDKGKFVVGAPGHDGSYYAKVRAVTDTAVGVCLAARSKTLKLD